MVEAGDDPDLVHQELLHTLGNLTVTAYNGQLSNNPFERKPGDSAGQPSGVEPCDFADLSVGRQEILDRASDLADRATSLWPPPLAGVEEPSSGRDWGRLHAALASLPPGR